MKLTFSILIENFEFSTESGRQVGDMMIIWGFFFHIL